MKNEQAVEYTMSLQGYVESLDNQNEKAINILDNLEQWADKNKSRRNTINYFWLMEKIKIMRGAIR